MQLEHWDLYSKTARLSIFKKAAISRALGQSELQEPISLLLSHDKKQGETATSSPTEKDKEEEETTASL